MLTHGQQVARCQHVSLAGQSRLIGIGMGNQQGPVILAGGKHRRKHTLERSQCTIKGQLTEKLAIGKALNWKLARSGQNAKGNGQIKATTFFGQVSGSEVDRNATSGEIEPGIQKSTANPLSALADAGLRETDNRKCGQTSREVDFNCNGGCRHANYGAGMNNSKHDNLPW
jgi:hypothetical protein